MIATTSNVSPACRCVQGAGAPASARPRFGASAHLSATATSSQRHDDLRDPQAVGLRRVERGIVQDAGGREQLGQRQQVEPRVEHPRFDGRDVHVPQFGDRGQPKRRAEQDAEQEGGAADDQPASGGVRRGAVAAPGDDRHSTGVDGEEGKAEECAGMMRIHQPGQRHARGRAPAQIDAADGFHQQPGAPRQQRERQELREVALREELTEAQRRIQIERGAHQRGRPRPSAGGIGGEERPRRQVGAGRVEQQRDHLHRDHASAARPAPSAPRGRPADARPARRS